MRDYVPTFPMPLALSTGQRGVRCAVRRASADRRVLSASAHRPSGRDVGAVRLRGSAARTSRPRVDQEREIAAHHALTESGRDARSAWVTGAVALVSNGTSIFRVTAEIPSEASSVPVRESPNVMLTV